jgi:hypothetical protein
VPDFKIEKNVAKPCQDGEKGANAPSRALGVDECAHGETPPYSKLVGSNPTPDTIKRGRPKVDHGFPCAGECTHYLDCWLEKGLTLPDWIAIRDVPQDPVDIDPVTE